MKLIYWLHIPKTGGMCCQNSLDWLPPSIGNNIESMITSNDYRIIRCPHEQIFQPLTNEQYIFFVRSPIDRFVSGFISRLRQGQPLLKILYSEAERQTFALYPSPEHLANDLYHDNPQTQTIARECLQSIIHLRLSLKTYLNSCQYLETYQNQIFYVGRTEHLTDDFNLLTNRLGLLNLNLVTDPIQCHVTPSKYQHLKNISSTAKHNIMMYYLEDYILIAKLKQLRLLDESYLEEEFKLLELQPEYQLRLQQENINLYPINYVEPEPESESESNTEIENTCNVMDPLNLTTINIITPVSELNINANINANTNTNTHTNTHTNTQIKTNCIKLWLNQSEIINIQQIINVNYVDQSTQTDI